MSRIKRKYIADNAISGTKIRLDNNEYIRSRNVDDDGDINLFKINSSNEILMGTALDAGANRIKNVATPAAAGDAVPRSYVDAAPIWKVHSLSYTDFASPGTQLELELFVLLPKQVIHGVVIKHSTSFVGGSLTGLTLSVGVTGDATKFISPFDVFQPVGPSTSSSSLVLEPENFEANTSIKINAQGTGDTLDNVTAGAVQIWVAVATLP